MEKIKTIAKYTINILAIISALVTGINAVEGITIPYAIQIIQIIAVVRLYATICQIFLFGATIGGNNFSVECGDAESVTRFYEQSSSQYESTVANFGDRCSLWCHGG